MAFGTFYVMIGNTVPADLMTYTDLQSIAWNNTYRFPFDSSSFFEPRILMQVQSFNLQPKFFGSQTNYAFIQPFQVESDYGPLRNGSGRQISVLFYLFPGSKVFHSVRCGAVQGISLAIDSEDSGIPMLGRVSE